MTYDSTVLADSPIRYYKLNETSGTTITDYGSQAQNGTLNGGVTLNQSSLASGLGASALFNGSTGYINLPTTSLPSGSSVMSIECWVQLTSIPGSGFQAAIMTGNTGTDAWELMAVKNATAQVSYGFGNDDLLAGSLSTATTYYLLGVWDGTLQNLYIGSGGTINHFTRTPGGAGVTYGSAFIGKDLFGDFWNGNISNVAIYSTALNSTQASNHYNAGLSGTTTNTRTITPVTAALKTTNTRTVGATAALKETFARTVPTSAALKVTSTLTVPNTAALKTTNTRTVSTTVSLVFTRTVPATAALKTTNTRTVHASASLTGVLVPTNAMAIVRSGNASVQVRSSNASVLIR